METCKTVKLAILALSGLPATGALGEFFNTHLGGTLKMGDTHSGGWLLCGNTGELTLFLPPPPCSVAGYPLHPNP